MIRSTSPHGADPAVLVAGPLRGTRPTTFVSRTRPTTFVLRSPPYEGSASRGQPHDVGQKRVAPAFLDFAADRAYNR